MSRIFAIAAVALAATAAPALASSDYLLQLPPAKGEVSPPIAIESWSFGVCNSGQCATAPRDHASGMASGRTAGKPNRASWDLATGKGGRMAAGGAAPVLGDLDGDGSPDLAFAGTQDEVYGLNFTVDASAPTVAAACAAGKIDSATLSNGSESYAVSSASVVCTRGGSGAAAASYAKSGINRIDSTPARISTNVTSPRQTQGASFGERCADGACAAGAVTMTFTAGQMKHTKSGHVTLLK